MRLTLILTEAETEALHRLAAMEGRDLRHQAERLLRAALVDDGGLDPLHRPCDRPTRDQAYRLIRAALEDLGVPLTARVAAWETDPGGAPRAIRITSAPPPAAPPPPPGR